MKTKEIVISAMADDSRKYKNHKRQQFTVFDQIDNFGDYTIEHDRGQPFMFISAKDCIEVKRFNPLNR